MSRHCPNRFKEVWAKQVAGKTDHTIREDISNRNGWYDDSVPENRVYMRLLLQEARKRGLGS